jgi:hypothetical protein
MVSCRTTTSVSGASPLRPPPTLTAYEHVHRFEHAPASAAWEPRSVWYCSRSLWKNGQTREDRGPGVPVVGVDDT